MRVQWKIIIALLLSAGIANAGYVTIDDVGNADDTTGYGGVSYEYKISDTEVTIAEMQASGAGDGDENYWNTGGRTVGTAAPASYVSLTEARKYCNWLTTGDVDSGYYGAGGNNMSGLSHIDYATANGTTYFVSTEDEWYKAAYYTGSGYSDYANGDDVADGAPTEGGGATGWNYNTVNSYPNYMRDTALGTAEQNGTVNMMGNVLEWMENSAGVLRAGSYYSNETLLRSSSRSDYNPSNEYFNVGFRPVEVVPEPATMGMLAILGLIIACYRRVRKHYFL